MYETWQFCWDGGTDTWRRELVARVPERSWAYDMARSAVSIINEPSYPGYTTRDHVVIYHPSGQIIWRSNP